MAPHCRSRWRVARPPETTPFRLAVTGDTHDLVLEGGAPRGFQSGRLRLGLDGAPVPVDEGESASMPDEAAHVALVYAALRDDILHGTATGFDHARSYQRRAIVTRLPNCVSQWTLSSLAQQ